MQVQEDKVSCPFCSLQLLWMMNDTLQQAVPNNSKLYMNYCDYAKQTAVTYL